VRASGQPNNPDVIISGPYSFASNRLIDSSAPSAASGRDLALINQKYTTYVLRLSLQVNSDCSKYLYNKQY